MYPYEEIKKAQDKLVEDWGDAGKKIIELCFNKEENRVNMEVNEFLQHCGACGGNWGGMLLTGIKELAPDIWEAIPNDMGIYAFADILAVLVLMRVNMND